MRRICCSVLASSNEKQRDSEKLLARWGRSLSQYCKCCSGMRCLACRRDPKGLLWTRNQGRTTVINDIPPPVATPGLDVPPLATNASCWSKLKARCRYNVLQLEFHSRLTTWILNARYLSAPSNKYNYIGVYNYICTYMCVYISYIYTWHKIDRTMYHYTNLFRKYYKQRYL